MVTSVIMKQVDLQGEVTILLNQINTGNRRSFSKVMDLAYQNLRQIAYMVSSKRFQDTMNPTSIVHEFFLRFSENVLEKKYKF